MALAGDTRRAPSEGGLSPGWEPAGSSDRPRGVPSSDHDRFRELFQQHFPDIAAYAVRRLPPEDAADLVAEVFLVAWRRLSIVPQGDDARLWLYGVARRTLGNQRRGGRRHERLMSALAAAPRSAATVAEPWLASDALGRLRPDEREVLLLAAWEGLSPAELATVLGCTTNAATIRLHRARRRLAEIFEEPAERTGPSRTWKVVKDGTS